MSKLDKLRELAVLCAEEIKNSYCEELWKKEDLKLNDLTFSCGQCRICRMKSLLKELGIPL